MLETSKEENTQSLGHGRAWDVPKDWACGMPKGRRERERKRGHGSLLCGMWSAGLDVLGTLWEVPLNRNKIWILFKTKQALKTSPTCIIFFCSFSYLTSFRKPIRRQLLEPLHPQNHTPLCTHGMPHKGSTRPLIDGHVQLDQIKWHPIKTIKNIN